jgi:hypothetical protein
MLQEVADPGYETPPKKKDPVTKKQAVLHGGSRHKLQTEDSRSAVCLVGLDRHIGWCWALRINEEPYKPHLIRLNT